MADNIVIGKSLRVNGAKPLDYLYGPYSDVEEMKRSIPRVLRYKGLTGAVIGELGNAVEYWFKAGITDLDLVKKFSSSSSESSWEENMEELKENLFNIIVLVSPKTVNTDNKQVFIEVTPTVTADSIKISRDGQIISENSSNIDFLDYVDTIPENSLNNIGSIITYSIDAVLNGNHKTINKNVIVTKVNSGGSSEPSEGEELLLIPVSLSWSNNKYTSYTGSGFTPSFPTLRGGSGLNITYSSSNTNVATINSSGTINIILPGATTISAFFAGDGIHSLSNTATYVLTVVPDTISSISIDGNVSPSSITTALTATVNINGVNVYYTSGYQTYVSKLNVTINVHGGTLNGTTFTPSEVGTATILVTYMGKTALKTITVTEVIIPKKNVEFGVGTSYGNATWTTIGQLTNNLRVDGISNNAGDYFFIKYDKRDTVNNLWINSSIPSSLELDSPIEDGDYKYRRTSTYRLASRSPIDYIINKN